MPYTECASLKVTEDISAPEHCVVCISHTRVNYLRTGSCAELECSQVSRGNAFVPEALDLPALGRYELAIR